MLCSDKHQYTRATQLSSPDVVVDGQVMPGIVLLDGLPILGNGDLVDRLIPVIARPAGTLLDAVDSIRETFGGSLAVLPDGDDVPFGVLGLVIAASGFEIHSKRGTFLRLLVPGDSVQCILGQLNLAVNYGITDCYRKAIFLLAVVVIAGFQLVYLLVQLIPAGRFRLLEGVNAVIGCARKQFCCERTVLYRVGSNRLAGLV